MADDSITVRGRVVLIRGGSRVAVVSLRTNGGGYDEYDLDFPLSCLPKGVRDGDEVEMTIRVRREEKKARKS